MEPGRTLGLMEDLSIRAGSWVKGIIAIERENGVLAVGLFLQCLTPD